MASPESLLRAAVACGLLDDAELHQLRREAGQQGRPLLPWVSFRRRLPQRAFYRALAESRGLPFLASSELASCQDLKTVLLPARRLLERGGLLPVREDSDGLLVACSDPDARAGFDTLRRALGRPLRPAIAEPRALELARSRLWGTSLPASIDAVHYFDELLAEAWNACASDIHISGQPDGWRVRMRIDGRLQEYAAQLPEALGLALISRVKVLAGLDIAEKRQPQDGGFSFPLPAGDGLKIDLRLATAPTRFGERATLRLLGVASAALELRELGLEADGLTALADFLARPAGLFLLTGPTGSGKTTTLYAAIRALLSSEINVMTVEDPVESILPGASQLQVDQAGKLSFAGALRSILRHDPDVIMVGEIRDRETAEIALKSALTGHAVLSSLHTNSALGSVTRLRDLGLDSPLIAATLALAIAQRLVRRLCLRCRQPRPFDAMVGRCLQWTAATAPELYAPGGCAHCLGSGYSGRVGLFELLQATPELRSAIARGEPETALAPLAQAAGLVPLRERACQSVLAGTTSFTEALQCGVL